MMDWKNLLTPIRLGETQSGNFHSSSRSAYEADYDRIIFSRPFRNLQDKTQVFPLPDQDFVHTRLTHSLEVSSVGRSLGKAVGEQITQRHKDLNVTPQDFGAIVGAAALAHDVGNPPFGHSGETAISDFFRFSKTGQRIKDHVTSAEWSDLSNFEGNAQGFRLLTRNQRQGLKLTLPTLAAFSKYPCASAFKKREKARKSQKKYGYFVSESKFFEEMASQLGLRRLSSSENTWCRHPLTFLVEAADDICYNIIDIEDGFGLGLISLAEVKHFFSEILQDRYKPEKLNQIHSDKEKVGVLRAVTINKLIDECAEVFVANEELLLSGEFDSALTQSIPSAKTLSDVGNFSVERLYKSHLVLAKEASGFEIIDNLLNCFATAVFNKYCDTSAYSGKSKSIYRLLPEEIRFNLDNETLTLYERMLLVTDYLSSLTDSSALRQYHILNGIKIY